jgi:hypothetical protein
MKRLAVLFAAVAGALAAVKSWRTRRADAQLWHEATAPRDDIP